MVNHLDRLQEYFQRYSLVIGVCIIIMLGTLIILLYQHNELKNEIIETGGFTDGQIKCVCDQAFYDEFKSWEELNPEIELTYPDNGKVKHTDV